MDRIQVAVAVCLTMATDVDRPLGRSAGGPPKAAKQPRGRNELHVALTANDGSTALQFIETGDALLLNQQSSSGCTPLMLLAMGHCDESLIWSLLERRGSLSIAARSSTRRTAADYAALAESKRSVAVVDALRALEAAEMERTAEQRCPVCGDVIPRRSLLDFFWERAERGMEESALLKRCFFAGDCYRELLKPRYHQINGLRQIRKELSESCALLEVLEHRLAVFGDEWHVVDLCCGKSITAALVSLRYPQAVVSAIDKLPPRFLPHLNAPSDNDGVHYMQLDVLDPLFLDELERVVRSVARPTVLLGMHLCGNLSIRAIDAFKRIQPIRAILLSPCCLPSKNDKQSPPHLFDTKDSAEQYQRWANHLERLLQEVLLEGGGVDALADAVVSQSMHEILSPKNAVISALRPSP